MLRHRLTDDQWDLVKAFLAARGGDQTPADRTLSRCSTVSFGSVRTGAPWRDLPEEFGPCAHHLAPV